MCHSLAALCHRIALSRALVYPAVLVLCLVAVGCSHVKIPFYGGSRSEVIGGPAGGASGHDAEIRALYSILLEGSQAEKVQATRHLGTLTPVSKKTVLVLRSILHAPPHEVSDLEKQTARDALAAIGVDTEEGRAKTELQADLGDLLVGLIGAGLQALETN